MCPPLPHSTHTLKSSHKTLAQLCPQSSLRVWFCTFCGMPWGMHRLPLHSMGKTDTFLFLLISAWALDRQLSFPSLSINTTKGEEEGEQRKGDKNVPRYCRCTEQHTFKNSKSHCSRLMEISFGACVSVDENKTLRKVGRALKVKRPLIEGKREEGLQIAKERTGSVERKCGVGWEMMQEEEWPTNMCINKRKSTHAVDIVASLPKHGIKGHFGWNGCLFNGQGKLQRA